MGVEAVVSDEAEPDGPLELVFGETLTLVLVDDVLPARALLALAEEAATLPAAEFALQSAV